MLKTYIQDGLELVIDELSGEVFASISGAARLLGVSKQAISKKASVNQTAMKTAETLNAAGLRSVNLLSEDQLADLVDHYKPELWRKFGKLGMRLSLQRAVNFEMSSHTMMRDIDAVVVQLLDRHKDHRPPHKGLQAMSL